MLDSVVFGSFLGDPTDLLETDTSVVFPSPDVIGTAEESFLLPAALDSLQGSSFSLVTVAYTGLAAVQLSPRTEGTNTPLKIYQQLASEIPLVATEIYSHTQVLDDSVAFLAAPEPRAFADKMIESIANSDAAIRIAGNARVLYEREYSRERYVDKLSQLLATLR